METRSWPVPARLVGQTIAIQAGKRVVLQPGGAIEQELQTRLGEDWRRTMPAGTVLATAILASMARVKHANLLAGYAVHDHCTEIGCFVGTGQTPIDPWEDFSPDRWLWFLTDVEVLREAVPAVGHQYFWQWYVDDCRR